MESSWKGIQIQDFCERMKCHEWRTDELSTRRAYEERQGFRSLSVDRGRISWLTVSKVLRLPISLSLSLLLSLSLSPHSFQASMRAERQSFALPLRCPSSSSSFCFGGIHGTRIIHTHLSLRPLRGVCIFLPYFPLTIGNSSVRFGSGPNRTV